MSRFFLILAALFLIFGISQYLSMRHYLYNSKNAILELQFHKIDFEVLEKLNTNEAISNYFEVSIKKLVDRNISVSAIDSSGNIINFSSVNEVLNEPKDPDKDKDIDKETDAGKSHYTVTVPKLPKEQYLKIMNKPGNLEHNYNLVKDKNNLTQMVAWRKTGNISAPSGLIQLSSPVDDIINILYRQVYIYLGGLLLILVIGSVLGAAIFKRTLDPLYDMTKTVEGITIGELNTRLPANSGSMEIDKLSESFNKMLAGIEASFQNEQRIKEKMKQFVSDASHELRTPLTSIHGFVEVLLRGAAKNEKQLDSALTSILNESERLTKLVQDLLTITRLNQKPSIEMSVQDINAVLNEIYPQLQILGGDRQLRLITEPNLQAEISKDQIKQVILNLTNNAIQHTDNKNGIIIISTSAEKIDSKDFVAIKVTDNGEGIPEKHLEKIFDRFFRSEYHRSRERGGYGLGLSIVKSIIDAHGGNITVESKPGVGTTFSVFLARSLT
jgi:two-component system OmpR family sensor kinase